MMPIEKHKKMRMEKYMIRRWIIQTEALLISVVKEEDLKIRFERDLELFEEEENKVRKRGI